MSLHFGGNQGKGLTLHQGKGLRWHHPCQHAVQLFHFMSLTTDSEQPKSQTIYLILKFSHVESSVVTTFS